MGALVAQGFKVPQHSWFESNTGPLLDVIPYLSLSENSLKLQ